MAYYEDSRMRRTWREGERGFSHYSMKWGTVEKTPEGGAKPVDGWDGWFDVRNDDGTRDLFNAERFITPELAKECGYGPDPREG